MYVQALTDTLQKYQFTTSTFNFPKPFENTPKVLLSVQSYYSDIQIKQRYKLSIETVTLTSVTVKVESLGTKLYELNIGILAVDYPQSDVFTQILSSDTEGQLTSIHKVANKIQSYVTFFTSFQGSSCEYLKFNLDSQQLDDYTIKVSANSFKCIGTIYYNILIIHYDNNFPYAPFYQYQNQIFQDQINSENLVSTNLNSPDTGFYGIKDMSIGSWYSFGIFFYPQNQNQPIQNGKYVFHTDKKKYIIYQAYSQVFDLIQLECPRDYYLYKQSCIISPYNGIYCLNNPKVCYDCDSTCLTCQDSATNCLKCVSPLYLYQNKCSSSIQQGTYCDENHICLACNQSCSTCINNANLCTSCINGYYFYNNICTKDQPNQTYCKQSLSQQYQKCFSCDMKCKKCSGPFYNQCSECLNNYYFYKNSCYIDQPEQTTCQNYKCQPCFNLCQTCSGVNQNQCLSCINNYSLNSNTNQCEISTCQDGYFPDKNLNSCLLCQLGCRKCSSFSVCLECASIKDNQGITQTYILDTQHQQCYLKCPNGKYFDLQTRQCTSCNKSCLTCDGKTSQNCLSCIDGAYINSNRMCECQNKNQGFASDFSKCISCQIKNCSKCFYSNTCDSCSEFALFNTQKNECTCMNGYFFSNSIQKCTKCIKNNCQTCLSDGLTCTKCQSGFLMTKYSTCVYCNNYQYSSDGKNCDLKCPNGCQVCANGKKCIQYSRDNPGGIPNQFCHNSCSSCSGLTKFDCLNCSSSTRIYNQTTRKCECISGYFESNLKDCSQIQQQALEMFSFQKKQLEQVNLSFQVVKWEKNPLNKSKLTSSNIIPGSTDNK
ncbi:H-type lectin domain protein (macronuclear) [Tetrahymena thermophila SB210]|uniref:H-type lectin domain protein n=1 Tax=Tetrahymena thermophila (strain SB210) TaxID=312017 RepID=Q23C30_TETTS|nr:H-type lectin domain protein [Tetrahymena thermophila SB210]EAR93938.2 H-type lectin domain protein [Tetrahymena thermophila SB210]|eukprot:XP_001014183.2 H-type lectin domain protein [Tetrahymena thermophila SB210]